MPTITTIPKPVKIILLIALALRIIVWSAALLDETRFLDPDSADYLRLAGELIDGHQFGSDEQVEIFRTPGYPFYLAITMFVANSFALPALIQIILDVALCFLVWRLANQLFAAKAAIASAMFQSVSVVSIVYSCKLLSDSVYAFMLMLFLNVLYELWTKSKTARAQTKSSMDGHKSVTNTITLSVACGALLSVMIYFRAITLLYLYIPLFAFLVRRKLSEVAIISLVTGILVLPWYYRNYRLGDYPHFSSVGAVNLYRYNACLVMSERNGINFHEQMSRIDGEFSTLNTQQEIANHAKKSGKEQILRNPFRYFWLHMKANKNNFLPAGGYLINMFGGEIGGQNTLSVLHSEGLAAGASHYFQGQWRLFVLLIPSLLLLATVYLLAAIGILTRIYMRKLVFFDAILIIGLIYFLVVPGGASHPRFRVPAAPLLSVYAGYGLMIAIGKITKFRDRSR